MKQAIDRQELDLKLSKKLADKQDKLTAGTGIDINSNNTISVEDNYVLNTGDTMTGQLFIERPSGSSGVTGTRTDTEVGAFFGVGSGGQAHGFYSEKFDRWILSANASTGNVDLNSSGAGGTFKINGIDFTSANTGANALANSLNEETTTPTDNTLIVSNSTASASTYIKKKLSHFWDYILTKIKGNAQTTRNNLGIRNYSPTGTVTNGMITYDVSDDFSAIQYAIAEVANTSSAYIVCHTAWSGTTVTIRYGQRSNLSNNDINNISAPTTRLLVFGTPK